MKIRQFSRNTSFFSSSFLHFLIVKKKWLVKPKWSYFLNEVFELIYSSRLEFKNNYYSMDCQHKKIHAFTQAVSEATFSKISKQNWLKFQSTPAYHMWHRPYGQTTGRNTDCIEVVRLAKNQNYHPMLVLRSIYGLVSTTWDHSVLDFFLILALFFVMKQFKYLATRFPEESNKAKKLRWGNIKFNKYGRITLHRKYIDIM